MEFNFIADGIDAVVIDNFYTEEQLSEIMLELKWLTKKSILVKEEKLNSAKTLDGEILTSKTGVFLEEVFRNWEHSALIAHGMTQTRSDEFIKTLIGFNPLFKMVAFCDRRNHLLSYYENSDYYKPHVDKLVFTILNYFCVEPKQFEGGEVVLYSCNSDKTATIEIKNNRTVLIASCTPHEVKPLTSNLKNTLSGNGRYCNAMFLSVEEKVNDSN
jgi:predicted 2-oxoglutarate/Fe(II)-dependent dioxygenase YbiX